MDSPLKFEVSKLSHLHIVQVLLPFAPGLVVAVGWMLANAPLVKAFSAIEAGYKTKLSLAIVITYLIGLGALTVISELQSVVTSLINRRGSKGCSWDNLYWRRVAAIYVGAPLTPGAASLTTEDFGRLFRSYGKLITQEPPPRLDEQIRKMRDTLQQLENAAVASGAVSRASEIAVAKQKLAGVDKQMLDAVADLEWFWLHLALGCGKDTESGRPFEASVLLMSSLQASGVMALVIMFQYPSLWYWSIAGFSLLLVIVTTRTLWQASELSAELTSASQIEAMIREIRQSPAGPTKPKETDATDSLTRDG